MNESLDAIRQVTGILDRLGIRYFICGSVAGASYGVLRTTLDVDIVAALTPDQVAPLVKALEGAYYVDAETIRDAIRRRSSFNLIHLQTMFKLDIFVPKDRPFDHMQFERRQERPIDEQGKYSVYVASAEDTILAKLEWYRLGREASDRQWLDVLALIEAQGPHLDRDYLRHWASVLGVGDLLERAIGEADLSE